MAAAIQALVVIDSGLSQESVERSLPKQGIEVVGMADGLESSSELIRETPSDILVVACAGYSERALFLIDTAVKQRPNRPVVVLAFSAPEGFMRRLFEMGADDVLELPVDPANVLFSFQKAVVRRQAGTTIAGAATGKIISVLGPKGGTGKTLTSTNLAVGLAQSGARTVLVDLDLQFGDVGLTLGMRPETTIYDLARAGGSIDEEKLSSYLTQHPLDLRVLLAPSRPDQANSISVELMRDIYSVLRKMADYIIVDTPPGFTAEVIATIDSSAAAVVVGMLDSLSLKNTKLGLETLDLMGFPAEDTYLVLNRANSQVGITEADVAAIVGRTPDVFVPSDREIPRAVNEGQPILVARPGSDAAQAFRRLTSLIVNAGVVALPKRSGLRRLLPRSA
jgi:MinD-like ATPase involved in chromosome partitioning or flagellar assembly